MIFWPFTYSESLLDKNIKAVNKSEGLPILFFGTRNEYFFINFLFCGLLLFKIPPGEIQLMFILDFAKITE